MCSPLLCLGCSVCSVWPEGIIHDGLWDVYNDHHMGICAEKCSKSYGIGRDAQDAHARESYERAALAWDKVRDLATGAGLFLYLFLYLFVVVVGGVCGAVVGCCCWCCRWCFVAVVAVVVVVVVVLS